MHQEEDVVNSLDLFYFEPFYQEFSVYELGLAVVGFLLLGYPYTTFIEYKVVVNSRRDSYSF